MTCTKNSIRKILHKIFSVEHLDDYTKIVFLGIKCKIFPKNGSKKENFELSGALANYRFYQPITSKIKIYLLNDTSREKGHLGCQTVINNINTLCRKNGMEIVFYDKSLPSNDRSIEAYGDVLQKCDAVIFNGEGSLHDGAAINMFEKCRLAKELGKKVFLINSVWQNNTETNRYLNLFDLVTFRESLSYEEALPFCKEEAMVVPDLAFYGDRLLHEDKNTTKLLFTDSVKASNSRKLYSLAKKYSAEFYGMTENACFPQLSEEVIANLDEKAKIVTGRFHTLVFAMKYKIPALVLTSNTHKIEGLLKDSGLEDYLLKIDKNAEQNITRFIASNNDDFVLKASKYTLEAQMKIENVFVKIRSFFKA